MTRNRIKLLRKWIVNNCCHWCGIETIFNFNRTNLITLSTATIDHVKSRLYFMGKSRDLPESNLVLACSRCNELRNMEEMVIKRNIPGLIKQYDTERRKFRKMRAKRQRKRERTKALRSMRSNYERSIG